MGVIVGGIIVGVYIVVVIIGMIFDSSESGGSDEDKNSEPSGSGNGYDGRRDSWNLKL